MEIKGNDLEKLRLDHKKIENRNIFKFRILTVMTIIIFFGLWQFVADQGIVDSRTLPRPKYTKLFLPS